MSPHQRAFGGAEWLMTVRGLSLPRGGAGKGQLRVDSRNQSALAKGRFRSERLGVGGFLIVPDRALLPARRNVFWAAKFEVGGADPEKRQKTSILGLKRGSKWLVLTPFSVVLAPALGRFAPIMVLNNPRRRRRT
jgi:hypothetical protein